MRVIPTTLVFVLLSSVLAADVGVDSGVPAPMPGPIAALVADLRVRDLHVRVHAAEALSKLGPRAAPAARELVEALGDPDEEVRKHVIDALTEVGYPAFRPLAGAVKHGSTQRRLLAFDVLMRIGGSWYYKPGPALKAISPALFDCLRDEDPNIRSRTIWCLGILGDVASIPHLLKLLESEEDIGVRAHAISRCGVFGEKGKQAIPVLERIVLAEYGKGQGSGSLGIDAITSLAAIGEPAAPVLARLLANAKLSSDLRRDVLWAVGRETQVSHVKYTVAIPAICKALADREEKVRGQALYALRHTVRQIGSADRVVIVALQNATKDKNLRFRIDAATILHEFDPQNEVILPTVVQALNHKEAGVRRCACDALEDIGPEACGTIPKLVHLMIHEKDAGVRLAATKALTRMGPGIVSTIPSIAAATNDPDPKVREAARDCLNRAKEYEAEHP